MGKTVIGKSVAPTQQWAYTIVAPLLRSPDLRRLGGISNAEPCLPVDSAIQF